MSSTKQSASTVGVNFEHDTTGAYILFSKENLGGWKWTPYHTYTRQKVLYLFFIFVIVDLSLNYVSLQNM